MRIVILCGGLEPGRDGVGDYSLYLAKALRCLGHSVLVIALNDRWLPEHSPAASHETPDGVTVKRLSSFLPWGERTDRVHGLLTNFHAEWVSLQLVCYGYHPKGVLFGFSRHLRRLAPACGNWQVIFHELWIGYDRGCPWKQRVNGAMQRYSIQRCIQALRPKLIETSTPLFQSLLKTIGIEASVLPLPGNIPVNPDAGRGWFLEVLGEPGGAVPAEKRGEYLAGGFFGTLYPNWKPEPFFSSLRAVARRTGQQVSIFAAGRMGEGEESIWNRLPKAYPDFHFRKLGELPAGRVSQYLQNLDFGIAASPWMVIGKSGAAAAMLDHGLPVMVPRNDYRPRQDFTVEPPADPLLILADQDVSDRFLAGLPRRAPLHSMEGLAARLVRKFQEACPAPGSG
jgi:hypothetical protein